MLIFPSIQHWLAVIMDYRFPACTWVCHFPNPSYIKRHNLLSLLSLHFHLLPFSFSQAIIGYGETERIRLPGNWKGARAARDVRLLWFITHRLMRITRVSLTRSVRGSGPRGVVGWKVQIDWVIAAGKWESREGGDCVRVRVVVWSSVRWGVCVWVSVCLNRLNRLSAGTTGLSEALYVQTELSVHWKRNFGFCKPV